MAFFQKILHHFRTSILLSDISITLIGVSLIIMALAALYLLFFKPKFYEKCMPWVGIAIRILMFIGFTLEFAHHTKISPLLSSNPGFDDGKEYTVTQLSNYLLYSYVFVVGIYDILTIGINKFRGFFHSFDIAMVSLPLIYTLTAVVVYIPKSSTFELMDLLIIILLLLMIFMIYLFFQLYWRQSTKWYVIFFIVAIPVVIVLACLKLKYPHALPIFLLLLGVYEGVRKLIGHIKAKKLEKVWKSLRYSSAAFMLVIMVFGLNFSGFNIFKGNDKYRVEMLFNKEVKLTTLQDAEKVARTALDDNKNRFILASGVGMDFYNFFYAELGEYKVQVSEVTGKVNNINYKDFKKPHAGSISAANVKNKTIELLKKCGYTCEENKTDISIEEQKDFYQVNIKNKFSNGKSNNLNHNEGICVGWFKNGELEYMNAGDTLLTLKDYKEIKIDEVTIAKGVKDWYVKLGEAMPSYALDRLNGFTEYSSAHNTLSIVCDNGNRLELDVKDGTVRHFDREVGNNVQLTKELYEKYKEKAVTVANEILPSRSGNKYEVDDRFGQAFYFLSREEDGINSHVSVGLDNNGKLNSFHEFSDAGFSQYGGKELSISKNKALSLVKSKYKTLGIYTERARLIKELQPNGDTELKWMVIAIPYMSREHHIYFVDVNTGEVNALQSYKEGLK